MHAIWCSLILLSIHPLYKFLRRKFFSLLPVVLLQVLFVNHHCSVRQPFPEHSSHCTKSCSCPKNGKCQGIGEALRCVWCKQTINALYIPLSCSQSRVQWASLSPISLPPCVFVKERDSKWTTFHASRSCRAPTVVCSIRSTHSIQQLPILWSVCLP